MATESTQRRTVRFGDCLLDLTSGELDCDGARSRLQEHPLRVLELLTTRPGEVVTREELVARLWPKGIVVDYDTGLNTAVRKLRAALGDDADAPRYIETIPRRGYRLLVAVEGSPLAPVSKLPAAAKADSPPSTLPDLSKGPVSAGATKQGSRRSGARRGLLIGTLFVALAGAAALLTWRPWSERLAPTPPSRIAPQLPGHAVAVLPFQNMSAADTNYLALGIAETVLYQLANLEQISVIARTSSFAFAGRGEDVREIGRQLNARYLLEGSVQSEADRLRVTAQLIDAATGVHVWSLRFDRRPEDVFAVQDEIALEVARALQVSLDPSTSHRITIRGTSNLSAWLTYLEGRALLSTRRVADVQAAIERFTQASKLDPQFVAAYSATAEAHLLLANLAGWRESYAARRAQALEAAAPLADKALALDANSAEAYAARATVRLHRGELAGAEADYRRSISLNPNNAAAYLQLGELLLNAERRNSDASFRDARRREEALAMIDRARELDPLEPRGHYVKAVYVGHDLGDIDECQKLLLKTLDVAPGFHPALTKLADIEFGIRGHFADAIKYSEQALRIDPQAEEIERKIIHWYVELGDLPAARAMLAGSKSGAIATAWLPIHVYLRDWRRAGELVYAHRLEAFESTGLASIALRQHARATGEIARARTFIEQHAGLRASQGQLAVDLQRLDAAIALADLMQLSGEIERAEPVLRAALTATETERPQLFAWRKRAVVFSLLGEETAALEALRLGLTTELNQFHGFLLEVEPAFAGLRGHPIFEALLQKTHTRVAAERKRLAELRRDGVVPNRSHQG